MSTTSLPTTSVLTPSYLIHSPLTRSPICFFHQHLAWQHFLHLLHLQLPSANQDVDEFLSSQRLQFIPGNSFGLPSGIGYRLGSGGWLAICEIPSVAEGMGHDEGWVQEEMRRGGICREGGEGGKVEGQEKTAQMEEVGQDGGQQTAGGTGSGDGGVTRSFPNSNQTRFPASQQQEPTIEALGTPAGSGVPFSSATPTSFPSTEPVMRSQQQRSTDGTFGSSTRPGTGMPFSSTPGPSFSSTPKGQQIASATEAFGSSSNKPLSISNGPQPFTNSNTPSGMQTPGTYTAPDGRIKKIPRGAGGNRRGN